MLIIAQNALPFCWFVGKRRLFNRQPLYTAYV